MGLKSLDLIWVDKKSASWRYPSEISELASFAPPMEDAAPVVSKQESKVISMVEEFADGRLMDWSKTEVAAKKSDTGNETRHTNHIVTLKPQVDQTRVRTIKSTGQPRIINVKVRDGAGTKESSDWLPTSSVNAAAVSDSSYLPAESREADITSTAVLPVSDSINRFFSIKSFSGDTDNKLELMVLMIGAISLLAIAYLLITSPY